MTMDGVNNVNPLYTSKEGLVKLDGGITINNTAYGVFKDKNGNSIYRVDYHNNDNANVYDSEEVRYPNGNLKSASRRSYDLNGDMMYEKHFYNENGNEIRVQLIYCDKNGNIQRTKELAPGEYNNSYFRVNPDNIIDQTPISEPSLYEKMKEWGAKLIGRNKFGL